MFEKFWEGILIMPTKFIQDSDFAGFYWTCEECGAQYDFGGDEPKEQAVYYCPKCGRKITEYI